LESNNILKEIEILWDLHLEVRATFPKAKVEHVGLKQISSPSYYANRGFNYKLEFDKPLEPEDVKRLNKLGHWLNQSFLVRLYSILEYNKIIGDNISIDKSLPGNEELDILRRLRHAFGHTSTYNPNDPDKKQLYDRIVKHFRLTNPDLNELPIPIDQVIEPILRSIKIYVLKKCD